MYTDLDKQKIFSVHLPVIFSISFGCSKRVPITYVLVEKQENYVLLRTLKLSPELCSTYNV